MVEIYNLDDKLINVRREDTMKKLRFTQMQILSMLMAIKKNSCFCVSVNCF